MATAAQVMALEREQVELEAEEEPIPLRGPRPRHHCQGHRLVLVLGKQTDPTIRSVLRWLLLQPPRAIHHRLWVRASSGASASWTDPQVPRLRKGKAVWGSVERLKRGRKKLSRALSLARSFDDCCFLEEVLVLAHGSTWGLYRELPRKLPGLLGGRPIRRLVLFSCGSADEIYPGFLGQGRHFGPLCGMVAPARCPCGCTIARCDSACLDPDGRAPHGYRCPDETDTGELLLAGWYARTAGGFRAARLGFDPDHPTRPLSSPDGRLRRVAVTRQRDRGHAAESSLVSEPRVFSDLVLRADGLLKSSSDTTFFDEQKRLRPSEAVLPKTRAIYTGPTAPPGAPGCLEDR